jgi:hypothetical protein
MGWATVLLGEPDTGKNIYTNILCALWGDRFSEPDVPTINSVTGTKACKTIHYKKIVVCNVLPTKNQWNVMKSRITDDTFTCTGSNSEGLPEKNLTNYFLCTSSAKTIRVERGDRRYIITYFILEVSSRRKGDVEYFKKLAELKSDPVFLSHLLSYFLKMDTTALNRFEPIMTDAKRRIMEASSR